MIYLIVKSVNQLCIQPLKYKGYNCRQIFKFFGAKKKYSACAISLLFHTIIYSNRMGDIGWMKNRKPGNSAVIYKIIVGYFS